MPDTEANQAEYPQPDGQKPGLGFPMIRMVVLFCLATGVVLDAAVGAYSGKGTGELSLLRSIWDQLQEGEVLLADRLYCSWFEMALLKQRGVDVVLHRHQSRRSDFRTGRSLGQRDHLVRWPKPDRPDWMDRETYASLPAELELRELEVDDPSEGFSARQADHRHYALGRSGISAGGLGGGVLAALACGVGLAVDEGDDADGRTPLQDASDGSQRDLGAFPRLQSDSRHDCSGVCGTWAQDPAKSASREPFKPSMRFSTSCCTAQDVQETYRRLLTAIATHRVGDRPGRVEPRAKKRRKKNYAVLTQPRSLAKKRLMKTT